MSVIVNFLPWCDLFAETDKITTVVTRYEIIKFISRNAFCFISAPGHLEHLVALTLVF